MGKNSRNSYQSSSKEQGASASLVMSTLVSCPLFILFVIRDHFSDNSSQIFIPTLLGFILTGFMLCFFWRRMKSSFSRQSSSAIFVTGLWVYLGSHACLIPYFPEFSHLFDVIALFLLLGTGLLASIAMLLQEKLTPAPVLFALAGLASAGVITSHIFLSGQLESWLPQLNQLKQLKNTGITISSSDYESQLISSSPQAAQAEEEIADEEVSEATHNKSHLEHDQRATSAAPKEISQPPRKLASLATQDVTVPNKAQTGTLLPAANQKLAQPAVRWGYDGNNGPHLWAKLSQSYRICDTGKEQSPIDIPNFWQPHGKLQLQYQATPFSVIDVGHTLQVNFIRPQELRLRNKVYQLKHMHFRGPSEHLLNGKSHPLEMQLFHVNSRGEQAVVAIFARLGRSHPEIDRLLKYLPASQGYLVKANEEQLQLQKLLPEDQSYFHYFGSMTTPPCREGVAWHVLNEAIEISEVQLQALRKRYRFNARPPQALNFR